MKITFYKLTPPAGDSFFAAMFEDKVRDGIAVASTRSGKWEDSEDLITNILFPEQDYNDWDIEVVKKGQVPKGWDKVGE